MQRYDEVRGDPEKFKRKEGRKDISNTLGFTTTINICGTTLVVSSAGSLPANSFVIRINHYPDENEGFLVDWENFGGLWRPADGIVSPWNTVLGGESHEPDGKSPPHELRLNSYLEPSSFTHQEPFWTKFLTKIVENY